MNPRHRDLGDPEGSVLFSPIGSLSEPEEPAPARNRDGAFWATVGLLTLLGVLGAVTYCSAGVT